MRLKKIIRIKLKYWSDCVCHKRYSIQRNHHQFCYMYMKPSSHVRDRGQKKRENAAKRETGCVWTFLFTSLRGFPRRRVNSRLWEGGHFHKNEGKARSKQHRKGASYNIHFDIRILKLISWLIVCARYLKNDFNARLRVKYPNCDNCARLKLTFKNRWFTEINE